MPTRDRLPLILLGLTLIALVALDWAPKADRFTWFMENFPVLLGAPLLVATHRRCSP
jgi:uncharacterized membrane protein YjdF